MHEQLIHHESKLAKSPCTSFTKDNVNQLLSSLKFPGPRNPFATTRNKLIDDLQSADRFDDVSFLQK